MAHCAAQRPIPPRPPIGPLQQTHTHHAALHRYHSCPACQPGWCHILRHATCLRSTARGALLLWRPPLWLVLGQWVDTTGGLQSSCLNMSCLILDAWCSQTAAAHAEHVQLGCQITASCTLLGQAEFLQHYGAAAAHNLQGLVGE